MTAGLQKAPLFPRRVFVAAGASALLAGSTVTLALMGNYSTVDTDTFLFIRGVTFGANEEDRLKAHLSPALADERIHVTILGHTGELGDPSANVALSKQRAELVRQIAVDLGISADRITSQGVGGMSPSSKLEDESDRAFQARLARVDVSLQLRR